MGTAGGMVEGVGAEVDTGRSVGAKRTAGVGGGGGTTPSGGAW